MSNESNALLGGCQCGAIRYELSQGPLALYVCHCTECRKQSASAFGISFIVPQTALPVTQGEPKFWSRPIHIWTSRMLPGIILPHGAAQLPGESDES